MFIPSFQLGVQLASSNTLQSFPLALRQSLLGLEAGADMDQWTAMESPGLWPVWGAKPAGPDG